MIQSRQLAGRGNGSPRTTEQLPLHLFLAVILLIAVAQPQAPAQAEEASPVETSGVFWEAFRLVSSTGAISDFSPRPTLKAAPDGRLLLSFNKATNVSEGTQKPYYTVFSRGTRSWSTPQPIYSGGTSQRYVTYAFDNSSVAHAVWLEGNEVYYAPESSWPTTARKLSSSGETIPDPPAIATGDNGVIHVVWTQGTNQQRVFYTYSRNGGGSWSSPAPLTASDHMASTASVAATADGNVHVVWGEATLDLSIPGYRYEIFYRKGTLQGTSYSWATAQKVSQDLTKAVRPVIIADGNDLHLGFTRFEAPQEQYAYYRRATAGSWGTLVNLNKSSELGVNTSNPYFLVTSLTVCKGEAHVYFHGAPYGETSEQVWGASSSDNWQSVSPVTPRGTRYIDPSVACDNGNLAIALDKVTLDNNVHDIYSGSQENRVLLPLIRGG